MLELYGTGYVIDHCISRLSQEREARLYRIYVTDALMGIMNTLHIAYGGGIITERYIDLLDPQPEETRSAEEIKNTILSKLRGEDDNDGVESI